MSTATDHLLQQILHLSERAGGSKGKQRSGQPWAHSLSTDAPAISACCACPYEEGEVLSGLSISGVGAGTGGRGGGTAERKSNSKRAASDGELTVGTALALTIRSKLTS